MVLMTPSNNHPTPSKSTGLSLLFPTTSRVHDEVMQTDFATAKPETRHPVVFTVCLSNDRQETVTGATAYQPEGPLTTFFAANSSRGVIDSWATRVASFRTSDVVSVRREVVRGETNRNQELVVEAA